MEASKYLDQRDVETQRKLVQQVDLYLQSRPTSSNDAGLFDQCVHASELVISFDF